MITNKLINRYDRRGKMKKQNQAITVMLSTVIAIFLTVGTSNLTAASVAIIFTVCIPFAVIGMISNERQSMIAFIVSALAIFGLTDVKYAVEVVMTFVIPSLILGRLVDSVSEKDDDDRQDPLYMGIIIFILSTIAYIIVAKYMMNIDVLKQLTDTFSNMAKTRLETMPKEQLKLIGDATPEELTNMFRNMIVSLLFVQSCMCVFFTYFLGGSIAKKLTEKNLNRVRMSELYLPGNAVVITFVIYLGVYGLSYMDTSLNVIAIMGNLQIIFNLMFMVQGISVCIYIIKNRIVRGRGGIVFPVILIVTLGVMGGGTLIALLGMLDCIMDFRKIKPKMRKSI